MVEPVHPGGKLAVLGQLHEHRLPLVVGWRWLVFVRQTKGKNQSSPWQQLKNQIYLGDEQFVERMQRQLNGDQSLDEVPSLHRRPVRKPLVDYARKDRPRNEAIIAAYHSGGYTQKQIADHFEVQYSWVSKLIRKSLAGGNRT